MERLSVDYGKKSKLEFAIYPAPQVNMFVVLNADKDVKYNFLKLYDSSTFKDLRFGVIVISPDPPKKVGQQILHTLFSEISSIHSPRSTYQLFAPLFQL